VYIAGDGTKFLDKELAKKYQRTLENKERMEEYAKKNTNLRNSRNL
jgi:hypothetical protein